MIGHKRLIEVSSPSDGYIQEIEYSNLKKITIDHQWIVCLKKVVGQFISKETRLLTIFYDEANLKSKSTDEAVIQEIQECIMIGNRKSETQDFSFTIQKIVEIAVKALSPGINDPNTVTYCLNILGVLLRDLADIKKGYIVVKEAEEVGLVIYETYDFELLIFDVYTQIMFYGGADATVVIAGFKSLRFIKAKATEENSKIIDEFARELFIKVVNRSFGELEFNKIQNEYNELTN